MRITPPGSRRGVTSTSTTAASSAACDSPSAQSAAIPPSEAPTTTGRRGSARATPTRSRTKSSRSYAPAGDQSLSPWPRRSRRQGAPAFASQAPRRAAPGVARLAASVQQQHGRGVRAPEGVAAQDEAVVAAQLDRSHLVAHGAGVAPRSRSGAPGYRLRAACALEALESRAAGSCPSARRDSAIRLAAERAAAPR